MDYSRVNYAVEVYNQFNDFPVAMSMLNDFSFDNLLKDNVKFSLVVISMEIRKGDGFIVKPLCVIYDKNVWRIHYSLINYSRDEFGCISFYTYVSCNHHSLDYFGRLRRFSCNNQEEIIKKSKIIIDKLEKRKDRKIKKLLKF